MTRRQEFWAKAAREEALRGNEMGATLFALIARPSAQERAHDHREHAVGFRRGGRRGFKCGIDGTVIRWIDPEEPS